jgi:photosystem II stability/assembly factor-like uncharacterized protein
MHAAAIFVRSTIALSLLGCEGMLTMTDPDGGPRPDRGTVLARDASRPRIDANRDARVVPDPGPWVNVTSNLAGMDSECGNISTLSAKPDEDMLIVGVALHGLWASTDGGESWHAIGTGAGSDPITNRTSSIIYDPDRPDVFWESGIYNGGGVFRTDDGGDSFQQLGDVWHNDLVAIDFGDPQRTTLLAGGHEQSQTVHLSRNGGATWENVGANLPSGTNHSGSPVILDANTFLVGVSGWAEAQSGVFRTENGGAEWTRVSEMAASNQPLVASDGAIYWPLIWGSGMIRSTDGGREWTQIAEGGTLKGVHPIELPDGRIATIGNDAIVISSNGGESWEPATTGPLPFGDPVGLAYSEQRRAFYIWHFSCENPVPDDAIMRHDYDYGG